jgi:TP901 family phage tail tape measure protein
MAVREEGTLTLRILAKDLASGNMSKFVGNLDKMTRRGGIAGSVFQGVGISLGMMLNPVTLGVTALKTLGDVIGGTISAAAKFEEGLATVNTVAQLTDEALADMGDQIQDVAIDSAKSTGELTAAMYDLVSAGVDATQAVDVLEDATTLATGALSTTGEAVDLMTSTLNAWGLQAEQSTRVMDVWAKTVALGKVNASQLSSSIAQIAPIASSTGVAIEEVAAGFATMTASGTPAAQAATQMRAAITALLKPNAQLVGLQESLGGATFEGILAQEGMAAALQAVSDAAGGNTADITAALGSAEAYNAMLQLTGKNAGRFQRNLRAMGRAAREGGTALEMAAQRTDTLEFRQQQLATATEVLAQDIGKALLPFMEALVTGMTAVVKAARGVVDGIGSIGTAVNEVLDPGKSLREELDALGSSLGDDASRQFDWFVRKAELTGDSLEDMTVAMQTAGLSGDEMALATRRLGAIIEASGAPIELVRARWAELMGGIDLTQFTMQTATERSAQLKATLLLLAEEFGQVAAAEDEQAEATAKANTARAQALQLYMAFVKEHPAVLTEMRDERREYMALIDAKRTDADATTKTLTPMQQLSRTTRQSAARFNELTGALQGTAFKGLRAIRSEAEQADTTWRKLIRGPDKNKQAMKELGKQIRRWERRYRRALDENDSAAAAFAASELGRLRTDRSNRKKQIDLMKDEKKKLDDIGTAAGKLPKKTSTRVTTPGADAAAAKLRTLAQLAASLSGSDIVIRADYQNSSTGQTKRGQYGMFLPPGRTGIVGEAGPEIIRFPMGARITPQNRAAIQGRGMGVAPNLSLHYAPQFSTASQAEAEQFMDRLGPAIVRWLRQQGT